MNHSNYATQVFNIDDLKDYIYKFAYGKNYNKTYISLLSKQLTYFNNKKSRYLKVGKIKDYVQSEFDYVFSKTSSINWYGADHHESNLIRYCKQYLNYKKYHCPKQKTI